LIKREHWTCPFCSRDCTLGDSDIRNISSTVYLSDDHGTAYGSHTVRICPNPDCRKLTITSFVAKINHLHEVTQTLHKSTLVPDGGAKPFPDYIPQQLRDDYNEACLILDKSPKASATLARRCLQGIIRDFWEVKKKNLFLEIAALEDQVDASTWKALDSVRTVGNIGAHMEKDVNVIVDVDPEEAELLTWLIETLFEEWYVERHTREEKMSRITQMAEEKAKQRKGEPQEAIPTGQIVGSTD